MPLLPLMPAFRFCLLSRYCGAMNRPKYEKGTFVVVPNRQMLRGMKPSAQSVFFWLCSFADAIGTCFPSHSTLGQHAGISVSTVKRSLALLAARGMLRIMPRRSQRGDPLSNVYQILILSLNAGSDKPEGQLNVTGRVGAQGTTNSTQIKLNPMNSTSRELKRRSNGLVQIRKILKNASLEPPIDDNGPKTVPP